MRRIKESSLLLLSFIVGLFIWFYVVSSQEIIVQKSVKLDYILPKNIALFNDVPRSVYLQLKGPRSFVQAFIKKEQSITFDIKKRFNPGQKEYEFFIDEDKFKAPFSVKIISIQPQKIKVLTDREIRKEVKVELSTYANIPSDHELKSLTFSPKKITLIGSKKLLSKVNEVVTQAMDLSSLKGVGEMTLEILTPNTLFQLSDHEVRVSYDTKPTKGNLVLKKIPINFITSNLNIKPSQREVDIEVLADNVKDLNLRRSLIQVTAKVPEDMIGKVDVDLQVKLPTGIYLKQLKPKKVEIEIP